MNAGKTFIRTTAAAGALAVATGLLTTSAGAAGWLATENVSPLAGIPADARLAVSDNGHAYAAWQAKSGDHLRIYTADRAPGQAWSQPQPLSISTKDAYDPEIAVNKSGDRVVSWRLYENPDMHLQIAARVDGEWWQGKTLGPADEYVVDSTVKIDNAGVVHAAWGANEGAVRSAEFNAKSDSLSSHFLSTKKPLALDMGIQADGRTTVVWAEATEDPEEDDLKETTYTPGNFAGIDTIESADIVGDVSLAVNKQGVMVASYTVKNGGQGLFAVAVRGFDGVWTLPDTLSNNGDNSVNSSAAVGGDGALVVAWQTQEGQVQVATRNPADSDWSSALPLATTNNPGAPTVEMNNRGDAAVIWPTEQPALALKVRKKGTNLFIGPSPLASGSLVLSNRDVALDAQGNVTTITGVKANATTGRVLSKTYDMAGPASKMNAPKNAFVTSNKIPLTWSATDRFSQVGSVDVLSWTAQYGANFESASVVLDNTTTGKGSFTAEPGNTYCFFARGLDTLGNMGPDSGFRCTTTPVDDRTPTTTGNWTDGTGKAFYEKTFRSTTQKGATLRLEGVMLSKLALVVAKGPGNGSVAVFFKGDKVASFSLASKSQKFKQVLKVKQQFDLPKTGDVVVKVTSAGKPVRIDGILAHQKLVVVK